MKEYNLSKKAWINKDVTIEFAPDESEFSSYKITKKGELGNIIKKLMDLLHFGSSYKVIKVKDMSHTEITVDATLYGWTLLRIIFFKPYFDIVKV